MRTTTPSSSLGRNLRPRTLTNAAISCTKKMEENHGSTRSLRVALSIILLFAWSCSVASIVVSLVSLIAQNDVQHHQAIGKMGISIGIFGVVTLFPILLLTVIKTRVSQINNTKGTPFQRWHGCISTLLSIAIITIAAVEFSQISQFTMKFVTVYPFIISRQIRHVESLVISILCFVMGSLSAAASILIICKPNQARNKDEVNSTSVDSFNKFKERKGNSKKLMNLSTDWEFSIPRLDFTPSPTYSIPRKRVDYFAYLSEQGIYDDESTQVGHDSFNHNHLNGWKEEESQNSHHHQSSRSACPSTTHTPAVNITIPARTKRATIHGQKDTF